MRDNGNWKIVKIGEVCEFINGDRGKNYPSLGDFVDRGIPFINTGHLKENRIYIENMNYITQEKYDRLGSGKVKKGDILYCLRGSLGKHAIVNGEEGAIASSLVILRTNDEKIKAEYLSILLDTNNIMLQQTKANNGSSQPNLSAASVKIFDIPLPSLETQKQIVTIFDKASQLIDLRKQQLAKMDLLIKSKFIAMFGDPVTNPMEWQAGCIRDVVSEVKYGTSKPSVANGEFVYLRMNNITYDGHLDLSNLKYIDIPDNEVEKYIVKKGDVLFNRTNSKELVGKTCVFGEKIPMVIAGYIIRVRPNKKANSYYISAVLNSHYGKTTLFGMCKSIIGQANINAQELQDIKINIPPIELQNQFAAFVTTVEQQKAVMQASLEKLEINYKSLMQQYFG